MVNRVNDYLHTKTTGGGINTETYEPLGGSVEVLDPYPDAVHPVPVPLVLTHDEALAILESHGGTGAPQLVSQLAGSAAGAGTASDGGAYSEALNFLLGKPMFSEQATRQRMLAIRQSLDQHTKAESATTSKVDTEARHKVTH